jgi:colicin import membrane protein
LPPQPEPPPPKPEPQPEPAPKPAPPLPQAKAPPVPKAPDIAVEKKKAEAERMQKLKQMQEAEEKMLADAARAEAEQMKKARDQQLAEQKKRELLRQMEEEALMQRMMDEELASEARKVSQAQAQAQAAAAASKRQAEVARIVGQYRDMIGTKVRGNTRLPEGLQGNPQVRCQVRLLPTGEVQEVRLLQSSGNKAYDEAVLRAIEKSSPLPLPSDRDARAEFLPELSFLHRPLSD